MTLRINHMSGKGSNRRATQDDNAYLSNYDSIFGKNKVQPLPDTVEQGIERYEKDQETTDDKDT